jgi:hypothetical protein
MMPEIGLCSLMMHVHRFQGFGLSDSNQLLGTDYSSNFQSYESAEVMFYAIYSVF